jgi:hypothetical protein
MRFPFPPSRLLARREAVVTPNTDPVFSTVDLINLRRHAAYMAARRAAIARVFAEVKS